MKDTKISLIIPTFNSSGTLTACLESIIQQSYKNIEILLIDGLSNDNTIEIAKNYSAKYNNVKYISEKDLGIYDAMNKGIERSSGEWLLFLGSDDRLYNEDAIESFFKKIDDNLQIAYGDVVFKISGKRYDGKFNYLKLLDRNICHQAIFYKRDVFKKLGVYELKYKGLADWVFNMKWFTKKNITRKYIPIIVAEYNEDGYCFNNTDYEFVKDRKKLQKLFPFYARFIFYYRNKTLIGRLYKQFSK